MNTTSNGKRILSRLLVTGLLVPASLHAQPGSAGFAFMKLGVSGRGISMGDAMSADVRGAAATYYNPAGIMAPLGGAGISQVMFMHKEWIQDTRMEFLGASVPFDQVNGIGVSVISTTVSDIEVRTRPGDAEGTFTARDFAAGVSYARLITDDVRVGITARFIYEKIFVDEASGVSVDAGVQWNSPMENLSLGGVIANIGRASMLRNQRSRLPTLLRVGPVYTAGFSEPSATLTLAADYVRNFPEERSLLNTGGEFSFQRTIALRIGYQFGSEGRGLTAGVGLEYGIVVLDYAYARLTSDLGNGHTISLALNL